MTNITENLKDLSGQIKGKIILPGDVDYDTARQVFSGEIDNKPQVIVRVADAEDIRKTIAFAKANNLEL